MALGTMQALPSKDTKNYLISYKTVFPLIKKTFFFPEKKNQMQQLHSL